MTRRHRCTIAALLALLALPGRPGRAAAQQPPPAPPAGARATPAGILVDFQDADLRVVIAALAEAARLNVIFGDLPARKITLRLRTPVPADSVRAVLRTIAQANGLQMTEPGGLLHFETRAPDPSVAAAARAAAGRTEPRLFIYRLKHARAARLAGTLQQVFGGAEYAEPAGLSRAPLSQRLREQQMAPIFGDTVGRRPTVQTQPAPLAAQMQGDVQIIPDETTNSLLVRASAADWEVIEQAIQAIDLRPLQVIIEVLIAEVRRSRDIDVSVKASVTRTKRGAAAPNASGELAGEPSGNPNELLLRLMTGGSVSIDVALSALATRGEVRILSRPVLLAQNNQEARILIGSQRPFVQVFRTLPTDAGVRDQVVQYRDVGTQLVILPTVNPDGYVNLQLTQEVSSATNETQFGAPVISTREASTFLFVRDGQTTVIGGLIDRQAERTRSGIPVLINIPLLGGLFGGTRNHDVHRELFLFLTPHVVTVDEDVDLLRERLERRLELLPKDIRRTPPALPPDSAAAPPPARRP